MERTINTEGFFKPIGSNPEPQVTTISPEHIKSQESPNMVEIKGLTHTFDKGSVNEYNIFNNFNLTVENIPGRGEVISFMGGSGCGKSCILKIIAGLMTPQSGELLIHGKNLKEYGNVPMVFQAYSNYEWMTVVDNVALPLVLKGVNKKDAQKKAMEIIKLVGLEQHAQKYAKSSNLSGGQLQRISIARCLANNSRVFLLDEATGALDIKMKREIQDLILKLCYESDYEPTILNVTHSVDEALYLSNKIYILKPNPCTIYKVMDIDYGTKRDSSILESQKFAEYSKELTRTLDEACK